MKSFFGSSHWKEFEENELEDVLSLKRDFETQKRIIKLDTCNNIVIKIPRSLEDNYEPKSDTSDNLFGNKIVLNRGKLRIDVSLLKKCFADPVGKVIGNVKKILPKKSTRNVSRIILVGGFSESLYVQGIFEAHFADKLIFIPPECGLAVLKGAVLFGQNPSIVTARIARFTYGLEIAVPFDPKIHPSDKRRNSHAGPVCIDSFWKAVEKGEVIKDGHEVSRVGKAAFNNQCRGELKIFKSKSRNPMFTTDHGCECIGIFVIPMNRRLKAEDSNVSEVFIFGSTELRVRAKQRTFRDTHEIYIHM
ncbi:heat shock 70 kDa protein 12A-like [Ruditapes philippinarum]|uniref:heat shock 70 kDa protein 12A-like n=1 Tax=Ruditapes philippinarum TaxID=129788 RepID=UPI00295B084E|nr:heat shock 70 kDa protein 12A-like [Ruditapes philippinarum]